MTPKISVLMTVYNGEAYLKECIDSILNQTFDDFEFLIIDDCSSDASRNIIKSYNDGRIHIIENRINLGQVKSLNIGLDIAAGEYIARIDQDDIMKRNRLKKQSDFLDKRQEISVVGAWGKVIDEKGMTFTETRLPIRNEEFIGSVLFGGYFLMHPSVMFRKGAIIAVGRYNETFSYAEDYDLWTRLLLKRNRFANIPEFLIKFRYHKNSASRKFNELQFENAYSAVSNFIGTIMSDSNLDRLCSMLVNAGLMNKEYWSSEVNLKNSKKTVALLEELITKTIHYFNLKNIEVYFMKKIFYGRMLNFAYESRFIRKDKAMELYLQCLKNSFFILEKPKLYLYPLKSLI